MIQIDDATQKNEIDKKRDTAYCFLRGERSYLDVY